MPPKGYKKSDLSETAAAVKMRKYRDKKRLSDEDAFLKKNNDNMKNYMRQKKKAEKQDDISALDMLKQYDSEGDEPTQDEETQNEENQNENQKDEHEPKLSRTQKKNKKNRERIKQILNGNKIPNP